MGQLNYLIEGLSGTGKTSVCDELARRGFEAIHGDRVLAYQGDPATGEPLEGVSHAHHIWDEARLRALAADRTRGVTFFCGGSRNFHRFLDVFDGVFVLTADLPTLLTRLARRGAEEFGGREEERALVARLHAQGGDTPEGEPIDAARPLSQVVDEILARCGNVRPSGGSA